MHKVDLTGKRFGSLIVVKESTIRDKGRNILLECICDCGKIKLTTRGRLLNDLTKSCGCLLKSSLNKNNNKLSKNQASFNRLFSIYKTSAKNRNIDFTLLKEEFETLTKQNCFYCNISPNKILKDFTKLLNGEYTYNGIDRVDNKVGYIISNCVPCCTICNYMKRSFSKQEFLLKIKEIYKTHCVEEVLE